MTVMIFVADRPVMSYDQKNAKAVLTAQALGGIVGISCGCLLGMLPLLLMGKGQTQQ